MEKKYIIPLRPLIQLLVKIGQIRLTELNGGGMP